jgi:2-oxoglutarate ferredoxin oxidoreductase subunit gamma
MTSKHDIRLCGFGGQGIVLAGHIIGQAAAVHEGLHAVFTQDYGPEARGGACRADVIVSNEPVLYPYIETPTVLVAMSQAGYDKYIGDIHDDTLVIVDEDLVDAYRHSEGLMRMPARRIAQELGRVAVANVVMLGFFIEATGIVSADALKRSVLSAVPPGTEKLNTNAFEQGLGYARARG